MAELQAAESDMQCFYSSPAFLAEQARVAHWAKQQLAHWAKQQPESMDARRALAIADDTAKRRLRVAKEAQYWAEMAARFDAPRTGALTADDLMNVHAVSDDGDYGLSCDLPGWLAAELAPTEFSSLPELIVPSFMY